MPTCLHTYRATYRHCYVLYLNAFVCTYMQACRGCMHACVARLWLSAALIAHASKTSRQTSHAPSCLSRMRPRSESGPPSSRRPGEPSDDSTARLGGAGPRMISGSVRTPFWSSSGADGSHLAQAARCASRARTRARVREGAAYGCDGANRRIGVRRAAQRAEMCKDKTKRVCKRRVV